MHKYSRHKRCHHSRNLRVDIDRRMLALHSHQSDDTETTRHEQDGIHVGWIAVAGEIGCDPATERVAPLSILESRKMTSCGLRVLVYDIWMSRP